MLGRVNDIKHIAEKVQNRVKELGGWTKITTKPTTANKETKIVTNSPQIKERFLFLDRTKIGFNRDYKRMMDMLTSYTMTGRNAHDDVPDGLSIAVLYLESLETTKVQAFKRPF